MGHPVIVKVNYVVKMLSLLILCVFCWSVCLFIVAMVVFTFLKMCLYLPVLINQFSSTFCICLSHVILSCLISFNHILTHLVSSAFPTGPGLSACDRIQGKRDRETRVERDRQRRRIAARERMKGLESEGKEGDGVI